LIDALLVENLSTMVQSGDFTIHLVNAETKEPLKEHEHSGQTYVEAEPDLDYFIVSECA
jgi:hypothetical protein